MATTAAGPVMLYATASAGLDILSGIFGSMAGSELAAAAESRGRMLRMEADADAQRYSEQARVTRAKTKLAYLKAGVELSGSPLDVLDSDILTAQENISAIRSRGAAQALDAEAQAGQARTSGRNAFLSGITGGFGKLMTGTYLANAAGDTASTNRKNVGTTNMGWQPTAQNANILNLNIYGK